MFFFLSVCGCLVFGLKPSVCYSGLGCEMCFSPLGSDESLSHMSQSSPASRGSPGPCSYTLCRSQEQSGVLSHESTVWVWVCVILQCVSVILEIAARAWLTSPGSACTINLRTCGVISRPVNQSVSKPLKQSTGRSKLQQRSKTS